MGGMSPWLWHFPSSQPEGSTASRSRGFGTWTAAQAKAFAELEPPRAAEYGDWAPSSFDFFAQDFEVPPPLPVGVALHAAETHAQLAADTPEILGPALAPAAIRQDSLERHYLANIDTDAGPRRTAPVHGPVTQQIVPYTIRTVPAAGLTSPAARPRSAESLTSTPATRTHLSAPGSAAAVTHHAPVRVGQAIAFEVPPVEWPAEITLTKQLEALAGNEFAPQWGQDTLVLLQELPSAGHARRDELLKALRQQAKRVEQVSIPQPATSEQTNLAGELRRAMYSLVRRLDIWDNVVRIRIAEAKLQAKAQAQATATTPISKGPVGKDRLVPPLNSLMPRIERLLGTGDIARRWKTHLKWDELQQLAELPANAESNDLQAHRLRIGIAILRNLEKTREGEAQRAFITQEPFATLEKVCVSWLQKASIDDAALLADVEAIETNQDVESSRRMAEWIDWFKWRGGERKALGLALEAHYRNANVRVAISGELLNRMLPRVSHSTEEIRDRVVGTETNSINRIVNNLKVRLHPDRSNFRFEVGADGHISSDSQSVKGPARILVQGESRYQAWKTLIVNRKGVSSARTEAAASTNSQLTDLETSFDGIPLFSALARVIARNQYESMAAEAQREVEGKIAARARERLDAEVGRELTKAQKEFQTKYVAPFERLGLQPTPLEMQTTQERVITRVRLAASEQVGAHTPRLQAPTDSLLSFQVHESAINNTFQQLQLAGRELPLEELFQVLTKAAGLKNVATPDELPEGVKVRFVEGQPIVIRMNEGKAHITVKIARLSQGKSVWRDFEVSAEYRLANTDRLQAYFVRDGIIELSGRRLGLGAQVALRGIFARVFSQNQPLAIVPESLSVDARLADLRVSQLEIVDGWLSVAMSVPSDPARVARQRTGSTK